VLLSFPLKIKTNIELKYLWMKYRTTITSGKLALRIWREVAGQNFAIAFTMRGGGVCRKEFTFLRRVLEKTEKGRKTNETTSQHLAVLPLSDDLCPLQICEFSDTPFCYLAVHRKLMSFS